MARLGDDFSEPPKNKRPVTHALSITHASQARPPLIIARDSPELNGLFDLCDQTRASAWSRSAMRSSGASIPMERRIMASVTPICLLVSGSTLEWVVVQG